MTCARRGAGAHRPAASTPSRSSSPRQAPPEDRSRPDAPGGRARLFLLLPVLALLFGALWLSAAGTAAAATTVWTAKLTVDRLGSDFAGCDDDDANQANCSSALTDNTFTYAGATYRIETINLDTDNDSLIFYFDKTVPLTVRNALTLHVGSSSFALTNGSWATNTNTNDNVEFSTTITWADNQKVNLKLTGGPPVKPRGFSAKAGYKQVTLRWDNPNNPSITKYQVWVHKVAHGSVGTLTDISGSGAGTTRHTVRGLENGATYRFNIRAVNAKGNSPYSDEVRATPLASATTTLHGMELSQFSVKPADKTRLKVTWWVKNPNHKRCVYRVSWGKADGSDERRYREVYDYSSRPWFYTFSLEAGTEYDVRVFVRPPGAGSVLFFGLNWRGFPEFFCSVRDDSSRFALI